MTDQQAGDRLEFAFDPPISALYVYYGALLSGRVATMEIFDNGGFSLDCGSL